MGCLTMNGLLEFTIFSHADKEELQKYGDNQFVDDVLKYKNIATELLRGVLLNSRPRVMIHRGKERYSKELMQTLSYVTKEEWGRDGSVAPSVCAIETYGITTEVANKFAKGREQIVCRGVTIEAISDKAIDCLNTLQSECGKEELFCGEVYHIFHKIRLDILRLYICLKVINSYPKEVFDTEIFGYASHLISKVHKLLSQEHKVLSKSPYTDLGQFYALIEGFESLLEPFDKMVFKTQYKICKFVYRGDYQKWCDMVFDICDYEHRLRIIQS